MLLPWLLSAVSHPSQTISSQSQAEYEFGQAIHFSLRIQGSDPISAVTLFYRSAESSVTTTVKIPVETDVEIQVEHTVELGQFQPAPFTTITYWWRVTDTAGNVLDVAAQTLAYEDDRFDWQQLTGDNIIVRWTTDDAALGQAALDIVNESLSRGMAIFPVEPPNPLRIYIYPSASDLQSSLRLTGRDWVGGHTNPELGVILVTAANARTAATDLRRSIPHELTHLMVYQATQTAYPDLPRWFDEGLATWMEDNPDPNEQLILEEAVSDGTTIPFAQLCSTFPADGRQALLAYAQSASLMNYIQSEYGSDVLSQMVMALADGADCESVTTRVLSISLTQLNENWLNSLAPQSSSIIFLQTNGVWLLLLAAGFGFMVFFLWPVRRGSD
ncbi:MAG: peptidase MA family metallohydrolase [Candidatus Promineifilaceae bacterium]